MHICLRFRSMEIDYRHLLFQLIEWLSVWEKFNLFKIEIIQHQSNVQHYDTIMCICVHWVIDRCGLSPNEYFDSAKSVVFIIKIADAHSFEHSVPTDEIDADWYQVSPQVLADSNFSGRFRSKIAFHELLSSYRRQNLQRVAKFVPGTTSSVNCICASYDARNSMVYCHPSPATPSIWNLEIKFESLFINQ